MGRSDVKHDVGNASGPVGREEVVEALLRAARELIAERGPSGVSLREISKHAGVNHGLVYMYIGTKDQLITEVFRQAGLEMAQRLDHVDNLTGGAGPVAACGGRVRHEIDGLGRARLE